MSSQGDTSFTEKAYATEDEVCEEHFLPLTHFCVDDFCLTCRVCAHTEHKSHLTVPSSHAKKVVMGCIKSCLNHVSDKTEELKQQSTDALNQRIDLWETLRSSKKKLKKLNLDEDELTNKMECLYHIENKAQYVITDYQKRNESMLNELQGLEKEMSTLLECTFSGTLISNFCNLQDRFSEIMEGMEPLDLNSDLLPELDCLQINLSQDQCEPDKNSDSVTSSQEGIPGTSCNADCPVQNELRTEASVKIPNESSERMDKENQKTAAYKHKKKIVKATDCTESRENDTQKTVYSESNEWFTRAAHGTTEKNEYEYKDKQTESKVEMKNELQKMETIQKKHKETRKSERIRAYFEDITLDKNTAHPNLNISADCKTVHCTGYKHPFQSSPERFDKIKAVVAEQSFAEGKHYWEVTVGTKKRWALGIMKKSTNRNGNVEPGPSTGYWIIMCQEVGWFPFPSRWIDILIDWFLFLPGTLSSSSCTIYQALQDKKQLISIASYPQKIGIYLNNNKGELSFYDADDKDNLVKIYTFRGKFGEVVPFFEPCWHDQGRNTLPLQISSNQ